MHKPHIEPLEKLLNRHEAERWLGLPERHLENLARIGAGPKYYQLSARHIRYSREELLRWRDAQLITPTRYVAPAAPAAPAAAPTAP